MKDWTVVGLYLDSKMPTVDWIKAGTGDEAEVAIEREREDDSSFIVVAVFEGKHEDKLT